MAKSICSFQEKIVEDSQRKKGKSLLALTSVIVLSTIHRKNPSKKEYIVTIDGIELTKFVSPVKL